MKSRGEILLTGGLIFLLTVVTHAQIRQLNRYEMDLDEFGNEFTAISLKKEGLGLVRELSRNGMGKRKWQVEILDTTLVKVWSMEMEMEPRMQLIGYEYFPGNLYLLYRMGETGIPEFQLKTILLKEQKIESASIKFELDFRITHFVISGGSAVFGGYMNNEAAVLLYNRENAQPKILPGLFLNELNLLDVRTNQNQSFNVLMLQGKTKENKKLIIRTYDHEGNLILEDVVYIDSRLNILDALTSTLENDELIVAGTYSEGGNHQSLGFFSFVVDPFNEKEITYTTFSSLQHFLDYLPQKKANRLKEKARKDKKTGNIPAYRAYVMPFRIEERNSEFFLLAEMYYPSHPSPYSYNNRNYSPTAYPYSPYGTNSYQSRYYSPYSSYYPSYPYSTTSDGNFKMIESLVVKMGKDGKIIRDISMRIKDVKQDNLEQFSDFYLQKDSITLVYKSESGVYYSQESDLQNEISTIQQEKIDTKVEGRIIKDERARSGGTRFWYDHYFYIWGIETIKGKDMRSNVFYVNRISLE